jgi:DNA-binding PadR family transcriptional regulator
MPHNEQGLTEREYFVLGNIAEPSRGQGNSMLHRFTAELERLAQRGYLERAVTGDPKGDQVSVYKITHKGRAAWQAYRFIGP